MRNSAKMKKPAWLCLLIMLCIVLLAVLSGCINDGGGEGGYREADPNKEAEITYYIWGDYSQNVKLAEQFTKIYPKWKVNVELATGNYYDSLKSFFGSGSAPDLFYMEPGEIMPFVKDGLLLNLSDYLEKGTNFTAADLWEVNDGLKYNPASKTLGSGNYYAFIKDLTTEFMMIYNKSHIDEFNAGKSEGERLHSVVGYPVEEGTGYPSSKVSMSWAQALSMCKLLSKSDAQGNLTRYGTILDQVPWKHFLQWVQQKGSSMFTNNDTEFNAADAGVIAAATLLRDFQFGDNKSSAPIAGGTVGGGSGFKNGDISVVWNGRWAFQSFGWYDADFEIGVAPPPMPTAGQETYACTGMVSQSISAKSKHPEVAYKFLEFFMTVGQKELAKTGFNIPGNKTVAYGDFLKAEDPYVLELNEYFLSYAEDLHPMIFNRYFDFNSVEAIFGQELSKSWDPNPANRLTVENALLSAKATIDMRIKQIKDRE
jgi:multiple sugar transport system substrate-binding protein